MLKIKVILLSSVIFAFCKSAAIIEKINKKCALSDNECQRDWFNSLLVEVADNGIPEIGVPPIDPYIIKNMDVVAFGMLKFTMLDGTAKGFKSCSSKSFKVNKETLSITEEFVCDLCSVEGTYKIESTPTLLALDGGINVHGEGKGSVTVEKIKFDFEYPFGVKKLDDGELHFQMKPDETTYNFEIFGNVTATADSIFIGNQNISAVAMNILNENWRAASNVLGRFILDKVLEFYHENIQKLFDIVPVKDLVTDDLSSFVEF